MSEVSKVLNVGLEKVVRVELAGNPASSVELLARLGRDEDDEVRRRVAGNRGAPGELLELLASDKDSRVRYAVANNANAPAKLLECLAGDEDCSVRRGVAQNPSAPVEILGRLARDPNERGVYQEISGHGVSMRILPSCWRIYDQDRVAAKKLL